MPIFFATNRHNNTAAQMSPTAFPTWAHVQHAARIGILMPDGQTANGIGRCRSRREFERRAANGKTTILGERY